jgi:hypothetical protein
MDLKYILHNKIEFCEGKTEKIKRKRHQPDLNRHHFRAEELSSTAGLSISL